MIDLGRNKIEMPLTLDELNAETILEYLPNILNLHNQNASEYVYWREYYKGDQPIRRKKRPYETTINNIVLQNHAFESVEFKKGFLFGEPVKYSSKVTDREDDIEKLSLYMLEQNKATLNLEIAENFLIGGTGYFACLPRRGIYDIDKQAPFELYVLDNQSTFVVYSTDISKEKILAGISVRIKGQTPQEQRYRLTIYTKEYEYVYEYVSPLSPVLPVSTSNFNLISQRQSAMQQIPIVEYPLNNVRMGIIELGHLLDEAINNLLSNNIDDLQQAVNAILMLINMDVDSDFIKSLRENGAFSVSTNDPTKPVDGKYLVNTLNHSDIRATYDILVQAQYDLRGYPRASGQVTSGGDTGQARLLGGGWTRSYINTLNDTLAFKKADRELLEIMLNICHKTPDCVIDVLTPADIEINFNINRSDNLLVKVQSLAQLNSMNMPKEAALNIVGITDDSRELAARWEETQAAVQPQPQPPTTDDETITTD